MLVTDYLVVGAGAASMAFVDTLLTEQPDINVVMVDRHAAPGGHWNDAYDFVRLHQPSLLYGVASKQMEGNWLKLLASGTLPWQHRASKEEILKYYQNLMDQWVASGRVQYFPNSTCHFSSSESQNNNNVHTFTNDETGEDYNVKVRVKLVNGIIGECLVPSKTPPTFPVDDAVTLLTPNQVFGLEKSSSWRPFSKSNDAKKKYVVLGCGKTAMDTVVFLQRALGVSPDNITWIIPNDVWLIRREGPGTPWSWGEALLETNLDVDKAALLLEKRGVFTRLDESVLPTKFRFPVVGKDELAYMRKVQNIVRYGRVTEITSNGEKVQVSFGSSFDPLELSPDHVFVHCTSPGPFNGNDQSTPFPSDNEIRLTFLYAPPVPISMSCIAELESRQRAGTLDLELGRKLFLLKGSSNKNPSENDVLNAFITGYDITAKDDVSAIAAAQMEPLKILAFFLALFSKDVTVGYKWLQRNRLSFFSIPGFKGEVYENVQRIMEKKDVLGVSSSDMNVMSELAKKLQPLEGK